MNKNGGRFVSLMKKYGPGFVAISESSGRVVAHGGDFEKMWKDAERKRINFSKVVISHVPKFGTLSVYWRG